MPVKPTFPVYVSPPRRSIRTMAIILLFAIFHYVAGYRLIYSLGILYAKEEAKGYIVEKNNSVRKLILSDSDYNSLKWTEEKKEFFINNQLYDVVSIQKSGNTYVISVYCDERETGWVLSLHNYEKEIFHPDQGAKGTKSAEDIISSFQKDCTPASGFKIAVFAITGPIKPRCSIPICLEQTQNPIWHPPTNC